MKAYLRSARIAPKKAAIIAKMVRGMPVSGALEALQHTHKKGARMVEQLLKSAVANAQHNDKQDPGVLVVKTIVVNQSVGYRRGVPMARGRMRPMTKFLSHISLTLGVAETGKAKPVTVKEAAPKATKTAKSPSQKSKNEVKGSRTRTQKGASGDANDASSASDSSAA